MRRYNPIRPDWVDRIILKYVQQKPNGCAVTELFSLLPGLRENLIRYRIKTLEEYGFLRSGHTLGRVIIYPAEDAEVTV